MNWTPEPFWVWWSSQMDQMAPPPTPDAEATALAMTLTTLLRGEAPPARAQRLGELRHGAKHWKRRR